MKRIYEITMANGEVWGAALIGAAAGFLVGDCVGRDYEDDSKRND